MKLFKRLMKKKTIQATNYSFGHVYVIDYIDGHTIARSYDQYGNMERYY